ncbi:hypothetical protein T439DRAFT_328958 [Meredithblackwellia eburnea MCA 4105]
MKTSSAIDEVWVSSADDGKQDGEGETEAGEASGSTSGSQRNPDGPKGKQKVSCTLCRQGKIRCDKPPDGPCSRCTKTGRECTLPAYRKPGRALGAKNKYYGVDRALKQIESGLKRLKRNSGNPDEALAALLDAEGVSTASHPPASSSLAGATQNANSAETLAQLPQITEGLPESQLSLDLFTSQSLLSLPIELPPHPSTSTANIAEPFDFSLPVDTTVSIHDPSPKHHQPSPISSKGMRTRSNKGNSVGSPSGSAHPVSNPLGLLAEASTAAGAGSPSPPRSPAQAFIIEEDPLRFLEGLLQGPVDSNLSQFQLPDKIVLEGLNSSFQGGSNEDVVYFKSRISRTIRDIGEKYDPILQALVTEEEARQFFQYFMDNVHKLIATMDAQIHTFEFVRSRSAFLFTTVLLCGSLFIPGSTAACTRLRLHSARLARAIVHEGFRSTEIIQGFMHYISWLPPPEHFSDERIPLNTSIAYTLATELGIDQPLGSTAHLNPTEEPLLQADLEGFDGGHREVVSRLIRNRERIWGRFYLIESTIAVALGRPSMFTETPPLFDNEWHLAEFATGEDHFTAACISLRKSFTLLSADVRARLRCRASEGADWITDFVDATLDPWRQHWIETSSPEIARYLSSIYRYGRLWILSTGLPRLSNAEETAAIAPKLAKDCLEAALDGISSGIEHHSSTNYFWHFPNQLAPSFAWMSILALHLWTPSEPLNPSCIISSQARLLGVIGHLAGILQTVGTTPSHRNGLSAVYAKHLFAVIKSHLAKLRSAQREEYEMVGLDQLKHEGPYNVGADVGTMPSGTITPIFGMENAFVQPFSSWGTDWWLTSAQEFSDP